MDTDGSLDNINPWERNARLQAEGEQFSTEEKPPAEPRGSFAAITGTKALSDNDRHRHYVDGWVMFTVKSHDLSAAVGDLHRAAMAATRTITGRPVHLQIDAWQNFDSISGTLEIWKVNASSGGTDSLVAQALAANAMSTIANLLIRDGYTAPTREEV